MNATATAAFNLALVTEPAEKYVVADDWFCQFMEVAMPLVPAAAITKLFVLDTNVILHDSCCLQNFAEHDIVIPITVLEELDKFKRGNDDINFQAREFLRQLDDLIGDALFDSGASLGAEKGSIRVVLGKELDSCLKASFFQDSPDHRILNTVLDLQRREQSRPVILISQDTNLRMKAKSLGLPAQDYTSDKIESFDKLYTGKRIIEGVPGDAISRFYENGASVPLATVPDVINPVPNENFIIRKGNKSVRGSGLSARRENHHLWHFASQCRTVVRAQGPD